MTLLDRCACGGPCVHDGSLAAEIAFFEDHYGHYVWDDESGDRYYIAGHVPARRAIAAVNRYCRVVGGMVNMFDEHGAPLSWVTVKHTYWRAEPQLDNDEVMVATTAQDLWGKPYTEVSL